MEQSNHPSYWTEPIPKEYIKSCNGQQREQQDSKEEELIKDGLTLDAVECRITDFPRLRYHNKLMKGLGDRFTELFQGDVQHVRFKDFVHWKQTNENPTIYLAGQDLDRKCSLVSKYKRHRVNIGTKDRQHSSTTFSKFKGCSPSCVLYSCDDKETKYKTIKSIKKLCEDVADSDLTIVGPCVIVVLTNEKHAISLDDFIDIGRARSDVKIVTLFGDTDLLEYLTSAFEVTMVEYINVLQITLMSLECLPLLHVNKLGSLKTESEAVLNRFRLASKLPKKKEISISMSIPSEVQDVLDSNADKIYGYGFRQKEFYILMNDDLSDKHACTLQVDILKSKEMAKFSWNIKFEKSRGISIAKHIGPGSQIIPNQNKPQEYGTLGGFAHINSKDVVGLTNFHVIGKDIVAYIKDDDNFVELGQCTFVLFPGPKSLADFALIEVDNSMVDRCRKPLVDDENEPKNATMGTPDHIIPAIVHKKGATTGITQGVVVDVMYYREVLGNRETRSAYLVKDTAEKPFSAPGDSGSLVFQNSLSATQSEIEVIAMVNGRYEEHDEVEESRHVVCSNMKFVHEKLQGVGKYLQFFEKEGPI
ncbi:uncharacterized protein LOC125679617 isoform X1 [Ostrea edulis]|uniref:uncharacterized protein LOC125679617 isoform X1 n=1 Tax=Ostrea edulis TaxID=37623 RepID=UPI0024AF55D0|nr:uncharacterized protein LOC125679617 isoform X1 [Ostrea edulis]XP_056018030.1 uncharacterized protein LOC125679617 isoform X1 [Ostrea edulis]XP_056018032.1 uncharacterized protein LOC125679617 isoform X1 [Ostrea edulis]XP_056018036.1 uncharacterized protein LOC125679617 isoform X1 [Ostrea edulis]